MIHRKTNIFEEQYQYQSKLDTPAIALPDLVYLGKLDPTGADMKFVNLP